MSDEPLRALQVAHAQETGLGASPVPGLDDLLTLIPTPPPYWPDDRAQWVYGACCYLGRRTYGHTVALGLALEEAHNRELWQGRAGTWRELLSDFGLDETRASKLRTIARVLVLDVGATDLDVAKIGDEEKAYILAVRARRALKRCESDLARAHVKVSVKALIDDAPHLSRSDLREEEDAARLPKAALCTQKLTVCKLTGEICPDEGCSFCRGGDESDEEGGDNARSD